jgi:AcrR family transcriptional regulator
MTTGRAQPITRLSERGAATRTALLMAAREIFLTEGYALAGATEIVTRAGASVGSRCHHFSGKAELYPALFEKLHDDRLGEPGTPCARPRRPVFGIRGSSAWWERGPTWPEACRSGS